MHKEVLRTPSLDNHVVRKKKRHWVPCRCTKRLLHGSGDSRWVSYHQCHNRRPVNMAFVAFGCEIAVTLYDAQQKGTSYLLYNI